MANTIHDLQDERKKLHEQSKAILDRAEAEGRDLNSEERSEYDRLDSEIDALGEKIEAKKQDDARRQKAKSRESALSEYNRTRQRANPVEAPRGSDDAEQFKSIYDHLQEATQMGASRHEALKEVLKERRSQDDMKVVRQAIAKFILGGAHSIDMQERAALQMDVTSQGGTIVMPEEFVARLIIGLDERVFMRGIATIFPMIKAESLGVPTLDADPDDADWTTELKIGNEDTAMSTGKRNLHPHPLGKLLKVSETLLRRAAISAEGLVRDRLAHKFAVSEEKGFLTGHGADQPLGVFTASSQGISTSRDVSTDNTSTEITADGLINAKYSLMSQYLMSANLRWIFHRTSVRNIRKLKDGNGQYLWTAGLSGQPDRILEVPYEMSEYAPSTFTSQQYVGIIGDFSWYWIAESLAFSLKRLDELYAATNQVGFIGRMEVDGMPVLEEAFARVKLA